MYSLPHRSMLLSIPLCPPHLAAHIPMGRHFFAILEVFSDFAGAPAAVVFMTVEVNPTRPSCLQPPTQDPPLFDNKRTLRYKSDKYGFKIQDQVQSL